MDYNTEVIRTRNSLQIRWRNEAGDLWTVTKKFNLNTRVLEDAEIDGPSGACPSCEERPSVDLALQMDAIFTRPEDFDRVEREYGRQPPDDMPALIWEDGVSILIAIAPRGAQ
jgi:hypothetical protein